MAEAEKKKTTRPRPSVPKGPANVVISSLSDEVAAQLRPKTANGSGWSLTKKVGVIGLSVLIGAAIVFGYLMFFAGNAPVKDTSVVVPANISIEAEAMAKTDEAITSISIANDNIDDAENKLDEAEAEDNKAKAKTFASRAKDLLKDAKGELKTADTNLDQAKTLINTKWANRIRDPSLKVQVQNQIDSQRDDYDLAQVDYDTAEARVNAILNPPVAAPVNTTPTQTIVYVKVPADNTTTPTAAAVTNNPATALNPGSGDLGILQGGIP